MEGVLHKRGDVVKNWRPRFFALQQGNLVYFKGSKAAGGLNLTGGRVVLEASGVGEGYRFAVEAEGKVWHLMSATAQELRAWVDALSAATGSGVVAQGRTDDGSPAPARTPPHGTAAGARSSGRGSGWAPPGGSPQASPSRSPVRPHRRRTFAAAEPAAASPLGTRRSSSHQGYEPFQSPGAGLLPGPGSAASTPTSVGPSPQRKRSFLSAVADVFTASPTASEAAKSVASAEPSPDYILPRASAAADAYNANLRPLGAGRPPMRVLMEGLGADLPSESLLEQYGRALLFVANHAADFSDDKLEILQGWQAIVKRLADNAAVATAARCMYVLEVTRSNPGWSAWTPHDVLYVSPENMVAELRRWPGVATLEDLKECIDFSSSAWVSLYCRLHGAELALEALLVHLQAVGEGVAEAGEAVTAALQCIHSLASGEAGMRACIHCPDFAPAVCVALEPRDAGRSELAVQLLAKACLFSQAGYAAVIHTLLGEPVPLSCLVDAAPAAAAEGQGGVPGAAAQQQTGQQPEAQAAQQPSPQPGAAKPAPAPPPLPPPRPGAKPSGATPAAAKPPPAPPPPPPRPGAKPSGATPAAAKPPPAPPPPSLPPPRPGAKPSGGSLAAAAKPPPVPPPPPPFKRPAAPSSSSSSSSSSTVTAARAAAQQSLAAQLQAKLGGASSGEAASSPEPAAAAPSQDAAAPVATPEAPASQVPQPAGTPQEDTPSTPRQDAAATPPPAQQGQQGQQERRPPSKAAVPSLQLDVVGEAGPPPISPALLPVANQMQSALLTPLSMCKRRSSSAMELPDFGGFAYLRTTPRARRDLCSLLLQLMQAQGSSEGSIDVELVDHVVRLISIACVSPEASAPSTAPLRRRFVESLLERGLLKVMADLAGDYDNNFLREELEMLKANIHNVLAPPQSKAAAPPPPTTPPPPPPAAVKAPPVPPPPPKAGPPPPPPPPGGLAKRPGPPPAPGFGLRQPVDPGPQPRLKMRSFFWDRLPDSRVAGTFWEAALRVGFDAEEVEGLFQAMQRKAGGPSSDRPASSQAPARKQLAVLDLKRATGIGIRMARMRVPWQQVPGAIAALDPCAFTCTEDVSAVAQCIPSEDEAKMLGAFLRTGGSLEGMSDAERFCWELAQIPRLPTRLRTFLLKFEAPQQLADAAQVLEHHQRAQEELRTCQLFASVLRHGLAIGNFLNYGTRLGAAAGFRLKSLRKLQDTRSLDGKTTLLAWLARQHCAAQPPEPLLSQQMPHVVSPKLRMSLQEVSESLAGVEAALSLLQGELGQCSPPVSVQLSVVAVVANGSSSTGTDSGAARSGSADGDVASGGGAANGGSSSAADAAGGMVAAEEERVLLSLKLDQYQEVMQATSAQVTQQLAAARAQLAEVRESFATLAAFFGESAAALGSEQELWGDVQPFVEQFSAAQKLYLQQRAAQEKLAAAQAKAAAAAAAPRSGAKPPRSSSSSSRVGNGRGSGQQGGAEPAEPPAGPSMPARKELSFSSSAISSCISSDGSALPGRVEELLREAESDA